MSQFWIPPSFVFARVATDRPMSSVTGVLGVWVACPPGHDFLFWALLAAVHAHVRSVFTLDLATTWIQRPGVDIITK